MIKLRKSPPVLLAALLLGSVVACSEPVFTPATAGGEARFHAQGPEPGGEQQANGGEGVFVGAGYDAVQPDTTAEGRGVFVGAGY